MSDQGQNNKDQELARKVDEAINNETDFSGYDINIRVVDGKVTLYGVVDTLSEVDHARKVVESIEGVEDIENNLTVSTDGAVDDSHVHMEVRQELEGEPRIKDASINVSVNNGNVYLQGTAKSLAEKNAVHEAASKAMGVKEIVDNIAVKPEEGRQKRPYDDASIVNEIQRTFSQEAEYNLGDKIEVRCQDGKVFMSGTASIEERDEARKLASKVSGVKEVNVHEVDTSRGELDRATQVTEKVKEAFSQDKTLQELPIEIYEENGHLVLDGIVRNTDQKEKVDKLLHTYMEEYGQDLISVDNKIRISN
ncbi:BON domain-containing protein [Natranaerobius thermophilus]|uniref:Transport-associated n=1 Tax=Natranaerobius thermophilus (strain ATCC BAA-1301 / DSM 18059 / JW/NM-WN-LF) TaxID=457570 RepID=B2A753_NATTJ|nr:BON domain-containing protein [Natranaerobius thermophilus]ACB85644.1 transport-associated [Natranaerobius thermophilus JW/NM-WN-LF]